MALPTLVLAWMLSLLPLVLPALGLDLELDHPVGLVLLVWLALAGLPRGRGAVATQRETSALAAAALALPPLVAALMASERTPYGADGVLGIYWLIGLSLFVVGGWLLVWLLAAATARARGAVRYGLAWLVLVPGLPLAAVALGWASSGGRGAPPGWLAWIAALSPLSWAHRWLIEGASAATPSFAGAAAVALVLFLLAAPDRGAARQGSAARGEQVESGNGTGSEPGASL